MVTTSDKEIVITNNGKPPKGEIAESGGLLSLRLSVEEAGGTMTVQSQPEFKLTI
jgi:signal transduction histidine kinase